MICFFFASLPSRRRDLPLLRGLGNSLRYRNASHPDRARHFCVVSHASPLHEPENIVLRNSLAIQMELQEVHILAFQAAGDESISVSISEVRAKGGKYCTQA